MLSRLPGLGPRSARRAALHLVKKRDTVLLPLADAMRAAGEAIKPCHTCHNLDTSDPCHVCGDSSRDAGIVCVVEQVGDLWALERGGAYRGTYHVLGGTLSALDGIRPEDLTVDSLLARVRAGSVREVIIALNATVDGQTTAHYLADMLHDASISVTRLAHGVPVGGELDYLDDGTLAAAMAARRVL